MPKTKNPRFLHIALALTIGFIWGNSLLPVEQSLTLSDSSAHWLISFLDPNSPVARFLSENMRKIAHFAEFTLLGIELYLLKADRLCAWRNGVATLSAGLWIAVADEALQMISARGPRISDVLLDLCGVLHGTLWALAVLLLIQHIQKRRATPDTITEKGE